MAEVSISPGNSKMGSVPSVSLPAKQTCRRCACWDKCYAAKLEQLRPSVRNAYQRNLNILRSNPQSYWDSVENAIAVARFFRFHVSGDIPDTDYFVKMVEMATRYPHCEILCFTKKYGIVNDWIRGGRKLPANLHMIFSAWVGLTMENPYHLPEAHVRYRNGTTTARTDAVPCGGNCTDCARTDSGCWTLKCGEQVVFHEH